MLSFFRRYRLWFPLCAIVLIVLSGRQLYFSVLPADGWLERGWYALRDGEYTEAERCFVWARRKAPNSEMAPLALAALYETELHGPPPATRLGPAGHLPIIGPRLRALNRELSERRAAYAVKLSRDAQEYAFRRYGDARMSRLFEEWKSYPRETEEMATAAWDAQQGNYTMALDRFTRLEDERPQAFNHIIRSFPPLLTLYQHVYWRLGLVRDVARLETLKRTLPRVQWPPSAAALAHNARMSILKVDPPARVWAVAGDRLWDDAWVTPRYDEKVFWLNTASLRGTDPQDVPSQAPARYLLLPAPRGGVSLLALPTTNHRLDDYFGWWRWDGLDWRAQRGGDVAALREILEHRLGGRENARILDFTRASSAWLGNVQYISLTGWLGSGPASLLLRRDAGLTQVPGQAPQQIIAHDGALWTHEDMGFDRMRPNGDVTEYRERTVVRLGKLFEPGRRLARLPIRLDPTWQLARDGAGRLWLVSWDGRAPAARAVWEHGTFRAATAAERAAADGGIVDAADRLWLAAELPRGFRRDAWRTPPGLPAVKTPATYAVDRRGQVWMISGGIAARWETNRWVSIINRLPGIHPTFDGLAAAGNGVLILESGMSPGALDTESLRFNERVCYLE
ncbi:MAG: hypothetical protein ACYC7E_01800 [Armatimonadota bacterium]